MSIEETSLPDAVALKQMMNAGIISSSELVEQCIERAIKFHPVINAYTELLIEQARKEAIRPTPGLLSGIPISLKESIDLKNKVCTYASRRKAPTIYEKDAAVVTLLKNEGAIVLARSNMPEFSVGPETHNLVFGRTNNPLNKKRTAGGSSGGEAALVATGSTVLGIGTDFGGSIRIPAAFCGLTGFKPVSNAVSKQGIFPRFNGFVETFFAIGPITRSVRDAKLIYEIIAGLKMKKNDDSEIKDLRLVYPSFNDRIKCARTKLAVNFAKILLLNQGMREVEHNIIDDQKLYTGFNRILAHSMEHEIHESLNISLIRESLNQILNRPTIHSWLFQVLIGMVLIKPGISGVKKIEQQIMTARYELYQFLADDGILILPTVGMLAPKHGKLFSINRRFGVTDILKPTVFCNILDLPAICMPVHRFRDRSSGLIPSIMLIVRPGNESKLFTLASWIEPQLN